MATEDNTTPAVGTKEPQFYKGPSNKLMMSFPWDLELECKREGEYSLRRYLKESAE
jgi:hypothetical protein